MDANGQEVLSRADCLDLLDGATIGRLGVSVGALPVILPVTFTVVDGDIVIRTEPGSDLDAAVNAVVAFEADGFDPVDHGEWTVLVQGIAEEVIDPEDLRRIERVARVQTSWNNGHFVRIPTRILSGRRVIADAAAKSAR